LLSLQGSLMHAEVVAEFIARPCFERQACFRSDNF